MSIYEKNSTLTLDLASYALGANAARQAILAGSTDELAMLANAFNRDGTVSPIEPIDFNSVMQGISKVMEENKVREERQ